MLVYPLLVVDNNVSAPVSANTITSTSPRHIRTSTNLDVVYTATNQTAGNNQSIGRKSSAQKESKTRKESVQFEYKDYSNLVGWSSDFHISTVKDIKDILSKFKVKIIDKSLSGHCHLTNTCENDLRVINRQNGKTYM